MNKLSCDGKRAEAIKTVLGSISYFFSFFQNQRKQYCQGRVYKPFERNHQELEQ